MVVVVKAEEVVDDGNEGASLADGVLPVLLFMMVLSIRETISKN